MTPRFADSFYFLALLNTRDASHAEALRSAAELLPIVTTAWVLTEVADALAAPPNRPLVRRLIEGFRTLRTVEVIPADADLFDRGLDLYFRRPDKGWSLTDCISFVVMSDRGLTDALTGDHHFEQAGFRALLRQPRCPQPSPETR